MELDGLGLIKVRQGASLLKYNSKTKSELLGIFIMHFSGGVLYIVAVAGIQSSDYPGKSVLLDQGNILLTGLNI